MAKLNFQHSIFQSNHSNADFVLKKYFLLLSMLTKKFCWLIFVGETFLFSILWWIEILKEEHLQYSKYKSLYINVFTVTFDQFNASMLNKGIHFLLNLNFMNRKMPQLTNQKHIPECYVSLKMCK